MLKQWRRRARAGVIVFALVAPLTLCVIFFLGLASYFALLDSLPPALAALVTAAGGIVLIAAILLIARLGSGGASRAPQQPPGRAPRELVEELEGALRGHMDPTLIDWVRRHPGKAAISTLLIGVVAGYSDRSRKILVDAYLRFQESEGVRRNRPE